MEKDEILKHIDDAGSKVIILSELNRIETFADSDFVPYHKHLLNDYAAIGIRVIEGTQLNDLQVNFVRAILPEGWRKQLNKTRDWRVEWRESAGMNGNRQGFQEIKNPLQLAAVAGLIHF